MKTVELQGSGGLNPSLSAELTGQNRSSKGQNPTNQWFVGFFVSTKSILKDTKRTVKDKVLSLIRYHSEQVIQNRIYEVRGCRVMLDFHLAELYQVEIRALKQAVKRNIGRFPSDFMIQLTKEEADTTLEHPLQWHLQKLV